MRIDRGNAGFVRSYIWDPSKPAAVRILTVTGREANGMLSEGAFLLRARDDEKRYLPLRGRVYGRRALYEYQPYGGLTRRKAIWGKKTGSTSRANTWMANWGWSITVLIGINSFDIFGTASFLLEICQRGLERDRYSCRVSSANFVEEVFWNSVWDSSCIRYVPGAVFV